MAQIRTFRCRFQPSLRVGMDHWVPMTEYLVPVSWWSYDDDRMDARGDAKLTKAQVEVKAYSPKEARTLVFREFGDYGRVGTPVQALKEL